MTELLTDKKVIAKQTGKQLSPELRKKYIEVQHIKEAGRVAIYGIEKGSKRKRRIGTSKFIQAWGQDPEPQKPVEAVWKSAGGDTLVTISGSHGLGGDGVELMQAEGRTDGIPRNEIIWPAPDKDQAPNQQRINELETQLQDLQGRFDDLETRFAELDQRNQELVADNQTLRDANAALQDRLNAITVDNLPITTAGPINTLSDSRASRYWNRSTGWVGSKMPWRTPPRPTLARVEEIDDQPTVITTVEERDGYAIEDRRRGAAAIILGATAVAVAAGAFALGYLAGENTEKTTVVENNPTAVNGFNGRHTELFNPAAGHRRTSVEMPASLQLSRDANGYFIITDNQNTPVVDHSDLPSGILKENGVLAQAAVNKLRAEGHKVAYGPLENTGPRALYQSEIY
jgi:TolA-binding protein